MDIPNLTSVGKLISGARIGRQQRKIFTEWIYNPIRSKALQPNPSAHHIFQSTITNTALLLNQLGKVIDVGIEPTNCTYNVILL